MKSSIAITELPAYRKLKKMFEEKGYTKGIKDEMPIYCWDDLRTISDKLTPGHFVYALEHGKMHFEGVPESFKTREFFLHILSGTEENIIKYVKSDPVRFDKQFFKDHIETNYYGLEFELNDFEWMPLEFIDEEMVMCAMFKSISMRYVDRRGDCKDWFYSVYRRKPEVLTQELYTLGARCFAAKRGEKNRFLDITPAEYRTSEFYYALCLKNNTPVMEDIPESILTTEFLVDLLNDSPDNIKCFSESALEREAEMEGRGNVKFWQAALINDGFQIESMDLNDERVEFFLSLYDKDSSEYEFGFKDHYKRYLRKKNEIAEPKNDTTEFAGIITLAGALMGLNTDSAVDLGNYAMNMASDRKTMLPIHYGKRVPEEYSKRYDREEYLLEIYKKLGIQVVEELDYYYYKVVLPEGISIVKDEYGYCIKNADGETVIHYYDRGSFYDRTVNVDDINVTL